MAGDRGVAGGADVLLFGLLVFVVTSLVVVNVWAVIDASLAVSAAARQGARTYVESAPEEAWPNAHLAMREVMASYGRDDSAMGTSAPTVVFERCAAVEITASYDIPLLSLPPFFEIGTTTVEATHSELIDPYRSGDFGGSCDD